MTHIFKKQNVLSFLLITFILIFGFVSKVNASGVFTKEADLEWNSSPFGSLTLDFHNNFYGMTYSNGVYGAGGIIKYNPKIATTTKEVVFNGMDGSHPEGDLTFDSTDNNFYGMTYGGGMNSFGNIFQYNSATASTTTEVTFNSANTGSYPVGNLTEDPNHPNTFYGMTVS